MIEFPNFVRARVFEGAGNTKPSMVLSLIRHWGLRTFLACVFYFVFGMGAVGIWTGMTLGNLVAAAISVIWLSKGTWKKKVMEEKPAVEPKLEQSNPQK